MLAAALALAPLCREEPSTEAWLAIGLGLRAARTGARSAVVVLALAREVGMLRLSVAPLGERSRSPTRARRSAAERVGSVVRRAGPAPLGLAVFTSEGCGLCRVLAPAVRRSARTRASSWAPSTKWTTSAAWAAADVPGQPLRGRAGARTAPCSPRAR